MLKSSVIQCTLRVAWPWGLVLLFAAVHAATSMAETLTFAHLSDPHLFDERRKVSSYGEPSNWVLFDKALEKLNDIADGQGVGNEINFVIVTGDLGLERLIDKETNQEDRGVDYSELDVSRGQVDLLAQRIRKSKVPRWFFVPGNNDLDDELAASVGYYESFIASLSKKVSAAAPGAPIVKDLSRGSHRSPNGQYVFLGLNNASFKNNGRTEDYKKNKESQDEALAMLSARLDKSFAEEPALLCALLFYHIPEVDDPHSIDKNKKDEKKVYPYSAWYVPKEHYVSFEWLSKEQPYPALEKRFLAPPLALKFQDKEPHTARGFQLVQLSPAETGGKRDLTIDRVIYWYTAKTKDWKEDRLGGRRPMCGKNPRGA